MSEIRPVAGRTDDLDVAATAYARDAAMASATERATLRDDFTRYCLPFADRVAHRYGGRGEPSEDLEQVSRMGLVKAIDRYDPERGSFTAFALLTMTGELKRHFRDRTWGLHVTRRVQDLSLEVGRASAEMTGELSRRPDAGEIATRLGVTREAVTEAMASAAGGYTPVSLNLPVTQGEPAELGDLLGDPDADIESIDDRVTLARLMRRLPAREQRMLAMRFYGNRSQREIGAEFGVSQMHVSRLLARTLGWLRDAMLSDTPPRWPGSEEAAEHLAWELVVRRVEGVLTVRVRGEIDRDTATPLRTCLKHTISSGGGERVAVDLAGVPLVDAAGVAALVDGAWAAGVAGTTFHLAGVRPSVRAVLEVCGLSDLLTR
jgi:RNA polymerase sigma-B factor